MNAHMWHTETLHIKYIYIEILIRLFMFFIERDVKEILCVWEREKELVREEREKEEKISMYIKKTDRDIDRDIAKLIYRERHWYELSPRQAYIFYHLLTTKSFLLLPRFQESGDIFNKSSSLYYKSWAAHYDV